MRYTSTSPQAIIMASLFSPADLAAYALNQRMDVSILTRELEARRADMVTIAEALRRTLVVIADPGTRESGVDAMLSRLPGVIDLMLDSVGPDAVSEYLPRVADHFDQVEKEARDQLGEGF